MRFRDFGYFWDEGSRFWTLLGAGLEILSISGMRVHDFEYLYDEGSRFRAHLGGFEYFWDEGSRFVEIWGASGKRVQDFGPCGGVI